MSREQDTDTTGKVDLKNTKTSSGTNITNVQRELNAQNSYTGKSANVAKGTTPSWNDNTYGTSSDSLFDRVEAIQTGVQNNDTDLTATPRWRKYTVSHTDLQAASLTNTIELFEAAAQVEIYRVIAKHSTNFSGGSISAYDIEVGLSSDADKYLRSFDVFQATGDDVYKHQTYGDVPNFAGTTSVKIKATSVGDNLDQTTQGSVDVWVLWSTLP